MKYLLLFIHLLIFFESHAQNIVIKGVITVEETKKPLEFAYIGIKGLETSSDSKGFFTLKIPKKYAQEKLEIRRTDYETKFLLPKEWRKKTVLAITLSIETAEEAEKKAIMEVEKNLNAMPKASHIIEDSARFRLVMPKNPIFKSTTKKYPEGDALVKVYMVMPNLLQDTTDTEPFYNFMYSDLPEMLVQKRGSSHFDSIIKNIGAQDNPLGLKFKDKKNIQREKYKGVEASFDSNEDGFYMKAYIYQVKNRFYIFTFMQIERYCTNEEIEGYLSKFEILE